jgi:hypothetical protein
MYLDCCYSAQFVTAFIGSLFNHRKGMVPGKFWCSSMPFQESFESDKVQHGVFTSYFMGDYTRKKHRGLLPGFLQAKNPSLSAGDVGKHTGNRQNPMLIDFSGDQDINITIPGAVPETLTDAQKDVPMANIRNGDDFAQWFNTYLQVVYNKNWRR